MLSRGCTEVAVLLKVSFGNRAGRTVNTRQPVQVPPSPLASGLFTSRMSQGEQEAPRPRREGHSPELRAPRVRCVLAVWRDEATLACRQERDAEPWASVGVGLGHLHGRAVSLGGWAQLAVLAPEAVVTVTHTLLHQDELSPLAPLVGSVRVASGQCLSRPLFTACPRKKTFTWPPTQFLQNPAPSLAVRGAL